MAGGQHGAVERRIEHLDQEIAEKGEELKAARSAWEKARPEDREHYKEIYTATEAYVKEQLANLRQERRELDAQLAGGAGPTPSTQAELRSINEKLEQLRLLRPRIELTASDCASAQWQKLSEHLPTAVHVDLTCRAPCCLQGAAPSATLPTFTWDPANREDAESNIVRVLEFLRAHMLPEDVTVVPVQSLQWLSGTFELGGVELVIKESKTDYVFILARAWDSLQQQLDIRVAGHKVNNSKRLQAELQTLLPYIIGLYEAKTPKALDNNFAKCRSQAILEYLAAQHMSGDGAPIVLFGDLNRNYCVHSGGIGRGGKPCIHVAAPPLLGHVTKQGSSPAPASSPAEVSMGFAKALLEKGREAALQRLSAGATCIHQCGTMAALPSASSHSPHGGSGHGGGGGGGGLGTDQLRDRPATADDAMEEAARMNAHAQQMMAAMRIPAVYRGCGLDQPPSSYTPAYEEDAAAVVQLLLVDQPPNYSLPGNQPEQTPQHQPDARAP